MARYWKRLLYNFTEQESAWKWTVIEPPWDAITTVLLTLTLLASRSLFSALRTVVILRISPMKMHNHHEQVAFQPAKTKNRAKENHKARSPFLSRDAWGCCCSMVIVLQYLKNNPFRLSSRVRLNMAQWLQIASGLWRGAIRTIFKNSRVQPWALGSGHCFSWNCWPLMVRGLRYYY